MTYNEFLESYGGVKVKFKSYYKYCFTFVPIEDTEIKSICISGSNNTYRFEVEADKTYTIQEIEPSSVYFKNSKYIDFDY